MTSLLVVFRIGRWRLGLECFQGHPPALLSTFDPGSSSIDPFDDTLNCLAAHQRHFDVVAGLGKRHGGSEPGLCLGYDKTLAWTSRTNQSCIVRARYLLSRGSAGTTHATRGSVAKTPYFSWNISCLAVIMGETGGSGHNPGWDGLAEIATIPNESRES